MINACQYHPFLSIHGEIGDGLLNPYDLMLGTCGLKTMCPKPRCDAGSCKNWTETCRNYAFAAPEYHVLVTVALYFTPEMMLGKNHALFHNTKYYTSNYIHDW